MQGEQYSLNFNVEPKISLVQKNEDVANIITEAGRGMGELIELADVEMRHFVQVLRRDAKISLCNSSRERYEMSSLKNPGGDA